MSVADSTAPLQQTSVADVTESLPSCLAHASAGQTRRISSHVLGTSSRGAY